VTISDSTIDQCDDHSIHRKKKKAAVSVPNQVERHQIELPEVNHKEIVSRAFSIFRFGTISKVIYPPLHLCDR
jgi:hypothetical protein